MAEKTATFGIKIDTETNADLSADSVEKLRKRVEASQETVKRYSATLRALKGSSDEVKEARERLKAAVKAEEGAISRATLALGKHDTLLGNTKKASDQQTASSKMLSTATAEVSGKLTEASGASVLAESAIMGLTGVVAGLVLGLGGAIIALAKFVVEGANLLRTQGLMREAILGNTGDAERFGQQIDALASKVPLARDELQQLSLDISRSFIGARISGQGIVDTFNAVGVASAAMGSQTGNALKSIIERGKQAGRIGIGLQELQGTGLQFTDIAEALSKGVGIGVQDAQTLLLQGRVPIDAGAKAIRDAVEKRFSKINAAKMLDLNVLAVKFKDTLRQLTSGVKLEPLLETLQRLGRLFDTSTVSGAALKDLITAFGSVVVAAFKIAGPVIEKFFIQFEIESFRFINNVLRVGIWVQKTFGIDLKKSFDASNSAVTAAQIAFWGLTAAVGAFAVVAAISAIPLLTVGAVIYYVVDAVKKLAGALDEIDWPATGKAVVDGFLAGLLSAPQALYNGVKQLAEGVKSSFTGALGIHSPSRVFAEYGSDTADGYTSGLQKGSGGANEAVGAMIQMPAPAAAGAGGGGHNFEININVTTGPGANAEQIKSDLTGGNFKASLLKALLEVMRDAGIPSGAT